MLPLSLLAVGFPWNHQMDSVMAHQHLIAAYAFTWGLQLAYLGYVVAKWRSLRKPSSR